MAATSARSASSTSRFRWSRVAALAAAALVLPVTVSLHAHKTVVSSFTYYADARPLLERRCGSCHDGTRTPPSLLRYDDAARAYPSMQRVLLEQRIPEHGTSLDHLELDLLLTWASGGTPEGPRPPGIPAPPPSRAHVAHAGEHGGFLLPLDGDTRHAEAIWSEQRRFRVEVTNVDGTLVPLASLATTPMRIAVDGADYALTPIADGTLEARVPSVPLPAKFTLISRGGVDRADLHFAAYSTAPPQAVVPPTPIPVDHAGKLAAIDAHVATVRQTLAANRFGQLYLPTSHIRNLLVTIPSADTQTRATLREMMRATWDLHLAGDNGTPRQAREAGKRFEAAVTQFAQIRKP